MNPDSLEEARSIFSGIKRSVKNLQNTDAVVCVPFVYLPILAKNVAPRVEVGAQDVFDKFSGAYTGETSPVMLRNLAATHVIIGHSERRALGDSDEAVNRKIIAAFHEDLKVIFCIGEETRDEDGAYLEVIRQEIIKGLAKVQKRYLSNLTIAYEPIWEIGKSDRYVMKGSDIYEMVIYIRKILGEIYDMSTAPEVPILYGGSVSSFNAENIIRDGHVNGLLVGRESLSPKSFGDILRIVDSVKDYE